MKKSIITFALMMVVSVAQLNAARVQVSSDAELTAALRSKPTCVVFVSATWCPHCSQMKPIIVQLASEMSNAQFIDIDDATGSFAAKHAPQGYPTIKIYKNGTLRQSVVGSQSKTTLQNMIGK